MRYRNDNEATNVRTFIEILLSFVISNDVISF
jgi:hypothetical protein